MTNPTFTLTNPIIIQMAMKITKILKDIAILRGMFLGEVSRKYVLPQGIGGINSERGGTRSLTKTICAPLYMLMILKEGTLIGI